MRCATTIGMIFASACAASVALASQQPHQKASPERVAQLIDKLGSVKFAERDRATKELDALGPAVLGVLRPALKSSDPEIVQRVQALVRKLEDRQLTATLLTGKRVRLQVTDATIYRAVADLAKESGYPVQGTIAANDTNDRKITLDTGETTFWAALQHLCEKAGLVETAPESSFSNFDNTLLDLQRRRMLEMHLTGAMNARLPSMLKLSAGKTKAVPTCNSGSVRVRVVKTSLSVGGNIDVLLEVTGEPSLVGFEGNGAMRIEKAVDDRDQQLTITPVQRADPQIGVGVINLGNAVNNFGLALNGRGGFNGVFDIPPTGFQSFEVEVRLQKGEKAAKKLKELTGKIGVKALVETEPMFVVEKILDAANKTVKGKNGTSLTVMEVAKLDNGDIRIQVSVDDVQNPVILGGIRVQAAGRVQVNGNQVIIVGTGGQRTEPSPLRLLDGKGGTFTQVETLQNGFLINGGQISQTETVVYRPKAGQGPAAQLILPARRAFAFEVPFSFGDVILPSQ